MKTDKAVFLDTNVLAYAADVHSPFHQETKHIRELGLRGELSLCLSFQIFNEFYAVITNPKRVVQPLSPGEALDEIKKYHSSVQIQKLYPNPKTLETLIDLIHRYDIMGQDIYDAQLVATMLSHEITQLYTYNTKDFKMNSGIDVLSFENIS